MADVITRFRLETTQYDSKLRDAAKGLKEVVRVAELGGKDFKNFSDKAIENARALGQTASGATNAKDRLKDLVGSFNEAAKAYNNLSQTQQQSDFGKALSQSLEQLQQRIKQTKDELYNLGDAVSGKSGGMFGGDKLSGMMQVFGGNVMTKIAGAGLSFASELGDAVKQGIELARQGEGIRIAFERLGRGDILDGLREATHGTVTDLELMKAAVKFNDFKLPLDELGTMLAFAQQKAKDTGQSVDYMVDSIVTGLGRKSVMILDNLGLSAAEIRDKMKETGDMTKAVGAIIREQMSKAGDYVETAADRALQANVSLQNKMEELGRKFSPLQEASNNLWTSIKIGIMDIVGGPLTNFINKLTEAGRLANQYGILGGSTKTGRLIQNLQNAREGNREGIYQQQQAEFWKYINPREQQLKDIRAWQRGERGDALQKRVLAITNKYGSLDATKIQAEVDSAKKMLSEYQQAAKSILNNGNATTETTTPTTPVPVEIKNPPKTDVFDASKVFFDTDKANLAAVRGIGGDSGPSDAYQAFLESERNNTDSLKSLTEALESLNESEGISKKGTGERKGEKNRRQNPYLHEGEDGKQTAKLNEVLGGLGGGLSTIAGGLEQMGIEIPEGINRAIGVVQGISAILTGIATTLLAIEAIEGADAIIPFAKGGIVKAFSGTLVGNTYSGDQLRGIDQSGQLYGLNAGEVVLNRAQVGNLASQLSGGMAAMQLSAVITGEQLRLVLNNNGRRTGRGEYVTTNFR